MPPLRQPGGLSGKMRVRYTARRKLGLLASAKHIMEEEGVTLRRAAKRLQVCHSLFVRWALARCTLLLIGAEALTPNIIKKVWGANDTVKRNLGGP